ncbi:MAG: 50S ribosomal protein L4 [Alphaproteobacteria bacterium]|jgi:large subunit ribosomal protein L4|nr:50S ribosomal protein L4 [Alphaproteobacteria bacterium]
MELKLIDIFTKKEVSTRKLGAIFSLEDIRFDIIKSVILWQQNKSRFGNHKTKTISEIRGTTAKPFKQKGTGSARQGSRRSAQFRGGATIFGPVVRSHNTKLPKKVKKLGLLNAIAYHLKGGTLQLVAEPKIDKPSTKEVASVIATKDIKTLIIYSSDTQKGFIQSVANLKNTNILHSDGANVYDIMNHDRLYISETAFNKLESRFTDGK